MSDKKKLLLAFLAIIILIPLASAAESFKLYTGESPNSLCPGSTGLYIDYIENTGSSNLEFTITKSGSASSFSTSVPQGFLIEPGRIKAIYTYVTPRTTTPIGNYDLRITATSNQGSESLSHQVIVNDCHQYSFQALENLKHVCPSDSERFSFRLKNDGQFLDTYKLSLEGEYASAVTLSETQFSLSPGSSKDIFAFVQTNSDDVGTHDFTLKVIPQAGSSIKTASSTLIVDSCYDFSIDTQQDFLEFCENSQKTVPITIKNKGSTGNTFNLVLKGPEWANIDKNKLDIAQGSSGNLNLILSPDYGVQGSFQIELTAEPERGNLKAINIFNINVKKCHSVSVDIEKDSDIICNSLENTYSVKLRNDGQFDKEYALNIEGPEWAAIDKNSVSLKAGKEDSATITVNPSFNVIPAKYLIKVKATARDSDKVSASDEISLNTVTREECFQAVVNIENKNVELAYDSTATVPVVIENRGAYTATYDLSLSGTASDFVYLNPSIITIEPTKSQVVYLYIAPTGQIANGDYSMTVAARLGDSPILSSQLVNIKVTESKAPAPEDTQREELETQTENIFQKIISFFRDIFKAEPTAENITEEIEEEQPSPNETEVNETISEEILEELTNKTTKLKEGDKERFLIDNEEHEIELTEAGEDKITLSVSSHQEQVELSVGESKKVDIDEDGVYDLLITFNGYENGEADISYERISELVEEIESTENEDEIDEALNNLTNESEEVLENATAGTQSSGISNFVSSITAAAKPTFDSVIQFILKYRSQIIGIIIILLIILIAAKTKFHKKIVSFFEEEIDEEPVIEEVKTVQEKKVKPEKPGKEVKKEPEKKPAKKEEKKEEKKPSKKDEDEEDDFIIEFDDDEDK